MADLFIADKQQLEQYMRLEARKDDRGVKKHRYRLHRRLMNSLIFNVHQFWSSSPLAQHNFFYYKTLNYQIM